MADIYIWWGSDMAAYNNNIIIKLLLETLVGMIINSKTRNSAVKYYLDDDVLKSEMCSN